MIIKPFEIIIFYTNETLSFAEKLFDQIGKNFQSYTKTKSHILTQEFLIRLKPITSLRGYNPNIAIVPSKEALTEEQKREVALYQNNIISYTEVFKEWEKLLFKNKQ